jgi:methylenetetrahydrofolate reductase (NADPH)
MMFPVRIEVIPSTGIVDQVRQTVPLTTTLTVTCLPHHGIERTMRAGVAGYPEGHPSVAALDLIDALQEKQHLATSVVTQMCFSAPKILDFAALLRREGVDLPVWAGVAGSVPRTKLVTLATQIGVGSSLKFLSRKGPLARRLLSGDRYSPNSLMAGLHGQPGIAGIHLYSFNNLEAVPDEVGPASSPKALQPAVIQGAAREF